MICIWPGGSPPAIAPRKSAKPPKAIIPAPAADAAARWCPGNPDLEPEESTSYELGLRFDNGQARFSATAYHTDLDNRIESRDTGETIDLGSGNVDLYEWYNVGAAEIRGLELTAGYALTPDLELSGTYTRTESKRLTGALKGEPLSRTPEDQASLRVDWQSPLDRLDLWAEGHYTGQSVYVESSSRGNTIVEYDGYSTVDIGALYAFNDHVSLSAAIFNLGDVDITDGDNGTAANGRTFWVALTVGF